MPKNSKKRGPHEPPTAPAIDAQTAAELLAMRGFCDHTDAPGADDGPDLLTWNMPHPSRDERDPTGKLEGCLLVALSGVLWGENKQTANGWLYSDDAHRRWKEAHADKFAEAYTALLGAGIDPHRHSREVLPEVQAWLTKRKS